MKMMLFYLTAFFLMHSTASIHGKWNVTSSTSGITNVEFKTDGSYTCYMNNAVVINGFYTFNADDSTLAVDDDGCLDITGRYKVNFSSADSIRFTTINDDCPSRRKSVESTLLVR